MKDVVRQAVFAAADRLERSGSSVWSVKTGLKVDGTDRTDVVQALNDWLAMNGGYAWTFLVVEEGEYVIRYHED